MAKYVDSECTNQCKFIEHGNTITRTITKREIDDEKLKLYISSICMNSAKILDKQGRSALHLAASNNKYKLAEWLILNGCSIHQKDTENGFTAFHRSIYYGWVNVAVLLKKYGASFDLFDSDFITPLMCCCSVSNENKTETVEVFVWGKNKNYNLGLGKIQVKDSPDALDFFRKNQITITKASINKYHSLFLCNDRILYGCGHSNEGRLGIGSENTLVNPQKINLKLGQKTERIKYLSAGMNHSLLLTNRAIYSTGSNKNFQLGLKNCENSLVFKEIPGFDKLDVNWNSMKAVIAQEYHSIFVSSHAVYVCGLNIGQFGGIQESIPVPRLLRVPLPVASPQILLVGSSNAAICIYLFDGKSRYLSIFYGKKVKTYKNPLMEKIEQLTVHGGELFYNSDEISQKNNRQKALTVIIFTENKTLYIWYEDIQQFVRVLISPLFTMQIQSISTCDDNLMILANEHLYKGTFQHKIAKNYNTTSDFQECHIKKELCQTLSTKLNVKRIPNITNAHSVYCDSDGTSFIALVKQIKLPLPIIPTDTYDFSQLMFDEGWTDNKIHDITFIVQNKYKFPANRFVVFTQCPYLEKLSNNAVDMTDVKLELELLTPEMFKCILKYLYTNNINENNVEQLLNEFKADENNFVSIINTFTKLLIEIDLLEMLTCLRSLRITQKITGRCTEKEFLSKVQWFNHDDHQDLYDVTIKLGENKEIKAHKVILMQRMEYFKMMFFHTWSEENIISLQNVTHEYLNPIINFCYSNDAEAFSNANYTENFMFNMIALCDQYLIENVKSIFEKIICGKVFLRNCGEILEFSFNYNCEILKKFCMEFIVQNLSRILEGSTLDNLDEDILLELSKFYRSYFHYNNSSNHTITPCSDAVTEEEIDKFIEDFQQLEICPLNIQQNSVKKPLKIKNQPSKSQLTKRTYEKEGMKNLMEKVEVDSLINDRSRKVSERIVDEKLDSSWHRAEKDKKEIKKKVLIAPMVLNEIIKSEPIPIAGNFVNLKSFNTSTSLEMTSPRNTITLADFTFKHSKVKKRTASEDEEQSKIVLASPKSPWNMESIELKAANNFNVGQSPITKKSPKVNKSASSNSSFNNPMGSAEKKFSLILKDEKKDKEMFQKSKSKSLILTQIEEKAILDLSVFYNIDNIFDENIKIGRKQNHVATSNFSLWQYQ